MKTQMKLQKVLCLLTLVLAALCFVYALAFMTDFNALKMYMASTNGGSVPSQYAQIGNPDAVYDIGLAATDKLFICGLVFLLVSLTLYITASHSRRNYYVSNFVSVIATSAVAVVVAILGIVTVSGVVSSYSSNIDAKFYYEINNKYVMNFPDDSTDSNTLKENGLWFGVEISASEYDKLVKAGKKYSGLYKKFANSYGDPTFIFVAGYVLYATTFAAGALGVADLVVKKKLMNGERALIANKNSEVA